MLRWLKQLRAFWLDRAPSASSTEQTATVSTRIDGDHNYVVQVVVQGGGTLPLSLRPTLWTGLPQDPENVAPLLHWGARLAPLFGRDAEMAQLRLWADSEDRVSIQVLHAPGGQGKTRLAAEFARSLTGWRSGWVDLSEFSPADALTWQGRCLLLVDYPEQHPVPLERLARAVERAAVQPDQRLRILLVARDERAVQAVFQSRASGAWLRTPLLLPELPSDSGYALVEASLQRLAGFFGRGLTPIARADFDAWRERHPLHHNPLFATALAIDLATRDSVRLAPDQWLSGPGLLAKLVEKEIRWWEKTAVGHGAPAGALTTVMAWATLSGRLNDSDINKTLAAHQNWSGADLRAIYFALAAACRRAGEHIWAPVEPDLLAAHFIDGWLADPLRQGSEAADSALSLALLRTEDVNVFDFHLNRLQMLAYDQTVRLGLRTSQDSHCLEWVMFSWAQACPEFRAALGRGFDRRSSWPGLLQLAAEVARRQLVELSTDATLAHRAQILNNLAIGLKDTGDWTGAIAAAQEAVTIGRNLVHANAPAYASLHAVGLATLAGILSETDDSSKALAPAQQAVAIFESLARTNPLAYEAAFASSLNSLAVILRKCGDRLGALMPARGAVAAFDKLSQVDRLRYEHELARSLVTLADCLGDVENWVDALPSVEGAVKIYGRLTKENPAAFEPDLARSLVTLANVLAKTGSFTGACANSQMAVDIYQRLAQANSKAYEHRWAAGQMNLANYLSECGRVDVALDLAKRAVAIYRRLAQRSSDLFESGLASSLINLSGILRKTNDRAGARASAEEALAIYCRIAQTNPAAYEPTLALTLSNLANTLCDSGEWNEALVCACDAVAIVRGLALANSSSFEPHLAIFLSNLSGIYRKVGDGASALAAAQEAVSIHRSLNLVKPAIYARDLATSLGNLSKVLHDTGDILGDIFAAQEAVDIYTRLVKSNPTVYEVDLANLLTNLAYSFLDVGDLTSALSSAQRSVAINRKLADSKPVAHEFALAMSLGALMQCRVATGDKRGAHLAGAEALGLLTALSEQSPGAFQAHIDELRQWLADLPEHA
jgi:tetratricopeptide (TPR) repeat protein